jgi:hypothetical protein
MSRKFIQGPKVEGAIDPEELTGRLQAHLGEMSLSPRTETPGIQTKQP